MKEGMDEASKERKRLKEGTILKEWIKSNFTRILFLLQLDGLKVSFRHQGWGFGKYLSLSFDLFLS